MNVHITLRNTNHGMSDLLIDELAQTLRDVNINCTLQRGSPVAGEKGDISTTLSIVALTLQSIGTLMSVLAYWRSTRPNYSFTARQGDETYAIGNLSAEAVTQRAVALTAKSDTLHIEVSQDDSQ